MSTESEASAQDVAKIIRQIKAEHIPAVFMENITDHRLLDQIARETGAKIGGDALFRRAVGARRAGADLSRHVPPQCRRADRGAVDLAVSWATHRPVMPGLVPGIHDLIDLEETWMAGTSPAMTS